MYEWRIRTMDEPNSRAIAERFHVSDAFARFLAARGFFASDALADFLRPRLSRLSPPEELPNMSAAADAVWAAARTGRRIAVYGDYDVDGISATAIMVRTLRALGAPVEPFLPHRMEDGYGLTPDTLGRCIEAHRPDLIVSVDCGSQSADAIRYASDRGVGVVVTDHHEITGEIAPAIAVVNPKLDPAARPWSALAGAGVAFKLAHAVLKRGRADGCAAAGRFDLRRLLDLAALGTVADCVPLTGENRILVRHGLKDMHRTDSPGLRALMDVAGLGDEIDAWHVGFMLAPRLNAAGRMGTAAEALDLLLADDAGRARELARSLDDANRKRQSVERSIVESAEEQILKDFSPERDFGLVIAGIAWHPGVIGIVASRLVRRFHRPVAVIALGDGDGAALARGSCRGIEGVDLAACLHECAPVLTRYGGHAMAAGLDIEPGRVGEFRDRFNAGIARQTGGSLPPPLFSVDAWVQLGEADERLLDAQNLARPFGQDHPAPVWAVRGASITGWSVLKGGHVRLSIEQNGVHRPAIAFGWGDRPAPAGPVDAAFELRNNTWNGRTSLQLQIKDIRPA